MRAAIDIGTNTVLLLVAEVEGNRINNIHEEHRVPRLGKGVDNDKNINEAATERVAEALREYRALLDAEYAEVKDVIVTATSAVRDAGNREAFIQKMKDESGFDIRLLSGNEEAEWTSAGALSVLDAKYPESLILDIGGGSTEVAFLKGNEVSDRYSFDMGSVRFTERFLKQDPPITEEINSCRSAVQNLFESHPLTVSKTAQAIGVAGTVTTLAGMALGLNNYEPDQINGFKVTLAQVKEVITLFSTNPHQQMLDRYPVYLKGRSDIFLAGMLILEGFMLYFGKKEVQVSTGGIRHGAILKTTTNS